MRDRSTIGLVLLILTVLSLLTILVMLFLISNGKASGLVIVIPGFPFESIVAGLVLGLLLIAEKRSLRRRR